MSKLVFKDVPYRYKTKRGVTVTKQAKRILAIMGDAIKDGKAVEFWQSPIKDGEIIIDTISLTVSD